jgi:hypothetical protein
VDGARSRGAPPIPARAGRASAPVLETGASAIAIGAADANAEATDYRFFALWHLRDEASSHDMLRITQASGWYDYFDTLTIVGEGCEITDHLEQLVEA